ncbi:MAG TPA: hypothetical protein VFG42_24305 [Baekduia sp.]|uniref:hypothetical protein n=1 Tax=Baekduia sp. TaxID=2600305 RepID=UPI002D797CEE|nr:hypothetical protein [Baekduia sp.]HET6509938.1 hypothetical protein [Baekduia sp.]
MEDGLIVISIDVADGAEAAYHAWHQAHIREVVDAVPSIVGARRYTLGAPESAAPPSPTSRFLALYAVAGGDVAAARAAIAAASAEGRVTPPPPGVVAGAVTLPYEAAAPIVD